MTRTTALWLTLAAIIFGISMILAPLVKADTGTPSRDRFWRPSDGWQRESGTYRHVRQKSVAKRQKSVAKRQKSVAKSRKWHKSTRVKAWRHIAPAIPVGCISRIDVVGDQRPTTKGAQEQALQSWRQEAKFRFGEMYADGAHAQEVAYQCVTSSVNNSLTRVLDTARQMVGGEEGLLHRCRISALACRAPMEAAE